MSSRQFAGSGTGPTGRRMSLRVSIALTLVCTVLLATAVAAVLSRWYVTRDVERLLDDIGWQGSGHGHGRMQMMRELFTSTGFDRRLTDSVLIAGLIGAAVAGLAGFVGATSVARPLTRLAERVRRLAAGEYRSAGGVGPESGAAAEASAIAEVVEMGAAVDSLDSQLAAAEALRKRLVEDLAHELRSPLTAVRGYAEGLLDGVFPDPASAVKGLQREIGRIERLIADLRRSALPSEAGPLSRIDLGELAAAVAAGFVAQAKERGIELAVNTGKPATAWVNGDRDRLSQVISNLLDNAIKYSPRGGAVEMEVGDHPGRDELHIVVSDTGPGIPAADLPHIFDRLYRAEPSRARTTGGSGIGLAVVKQIALAHGGTVSARNAPGGGGAVFTVRLPRA